MRRTTPRSRHDAADTGYPLDVPGIYELRVCCPPIKVLADAGGGSRHNRFVPGSGRPAAACHPVRAHTSSRAAVARHEHALKIAGIRPQDLRLDGMRCAPRSRSLPRQAPRQGRGRRPELPLAPIDFADRRCLDD